MNRCVAFALLFSLAPAAHAAGSGMFLCISPVYANSFWEDMKGMRDKGINVTRDIAETLARNNKCNYVPGTNLKPINFVAGQLEITDGKTKGWSSPFMYIIYVNQ